MTANPKISPAFEPFLARSGPNDKREAIVLYRAPEADGRRPRGRLRVLKERLRYVRARAAAQRPVQEQIFQSYRAETGGREPQNGQTFEATPVGSGALPVATVEVTPATLPALAEQPDVVAILPNQKIHLILPKEVDYKKLRKREQSDGLTWGLKRLGIADLWATTKGRDINVAVLDTGVYADHPALAGRVQDFVVVDPLGRRIAAKPPFDCGTHGTHVCGTIAGGRTAEGVAIGVAPEANLLVAGVLLGDATLRSLLEGISWAVERGADIINMSLGFTYYEPKFAEVFSLLVEQYDVLPVVAIGNENHGNCSSPGNAHSAFSVGAAEAMPRNKLDVAFFSSGASLVFPGDEAHSLVTKPDVVAPGVQVFSCIPPERKPDGVYDYSYMDGTSMAAPHVAGVAALLMATRPEATALEVMRALKETAAHPGGADRRPDNRWGHGLIQPAAALAALG
jgi:serine protease AprX